MGYLVFILTFMVYFWICWWCLSIFISKILPIFKCKNTTTSAINCFWIRMSRKKLYIFENWGSKLIEHWTQVKIRHIEKLMGQIKTKFCCICVFHIIFIQDFWWQCFLPCTIMRLECWGLLYLFQFFFCIKCVQKYNML